MTMMTQCRLVRHDGDIDNAFIDSTLAQEGRIVDLKIDGAWNRGWRVETVGSSMDSTMVQARERDFKNHRKATDI